MRQLLHLCRDDPEAQAAIDEAVQHRAGKPTFNNIKDKAPVGTSRQAALRKLRKESGRPEVKALYEGVLAGELSAHAAMVKAGFRKPETPLLRLQRAWRAASEAERREFVEAERETLQRMFGSLESA